ncbi:MAG TPA: dephospho-CoA kinase [Chitinivibrionales bacterium]|nr:dephospho-CoA kinase [Chitinivibrionales bacterium]
MPHHNTAPVRIGIAGYMGSGKSVCAGMCAELTGMRIIDADAEAKLLMKNDSRIREELAGVFGPSVDKRGTIDFAALGVTAFASAAAMQNLNTIVHPRLVRRLRDCVFDRPGPSILDAALISLWRIEDWFDCCMWVDAPAPLRLARIAAKTGLPEPQLRQRMLVQEELVARPSGVKWIFIVNAGTREALQSSVERFVNSREFLKR